MSRSPLRAAALLLGTASVPALGAPLNTLDRANTLVTIDSAAPGTIIGSRPITGIAAGQTLLGLDARPASNRLLYGLSNTGQLYAINANTAVATAIGTPTAAPVGALGIDFNPTVDRIRVVTSTGLNYRVNPDTGAIAGTDTRLAYAAGDAGAGVQPLVGSVAYTNNVGGATSTTLYAIESNRIQLVRIGSLAGDAAVVSPNTGQVFSVGTLGLAEAPALDSAFDISASGEAVAALNVNGTTGLYRINLTNGTATLIGNFGSNYTGLSFAPARIVTFATTANQQAIGNALDNFTGLPSAALTTAFNDFDASTPAGRSAALAQFTPAGYSLLPELTLRAAEFQEQTVRRYLRDFRAGGTGVEGTAGVAAPGDRVFGSFLVASGSFGRYDAAGDRSRTDFGTQSVLAGVDLRLGAKSLIGVMGGYSNMDVNLDATSPRSGIGSWFGGGYGTLGVGPFYVDLFGSYGEADYDLRRGVRFGNTNLGFDTDGKSRTWLAGGTVGLSFNFAGFELEPFAGVRYANLKLQGIDEGTGLGALQLQQRTYESVLHNVGIRVGGALEIGGATVRPEIRGAWRHEYMRDQFDGFTFGFGGTGGANTLAFTPVALNRDYATAGAGFTISGPTSPLSVVIDYNGEYDKSREIHAITGGLRLTF